MRPVALFIFIIVVLMPIRVIAADNSTQPIASIPYEIAYDGWVTVKLNVNGKGPYDFIIDTGATLTLVFENLKKEQSFTPTDLPPRRILGLSSAITAPVTKIGEINVGGAVLEDHHGVVLSDWAQPRKTPQGVLGLDFLSRYLVLVDVKSKQIELYEPGTELSKMRRWFTVPLTAETFGQDVGALYTIDVRVNNRTAPFIVDLGAAGTILNFAMLNELYAGVRFNPSRTSGAVTGSRLNDINDNRENGQFIRVLRVKIGRSHWRRPILFVFDAEIFRELGVASKPYGLLGIDLLQDRSFALDFKSGAFHIDRTPKRSR